MIKANYMGMNPKISVEKPEYIVRGCFVEMIIGELEITLDEKDAKYLYGELDAKLYEETAQELSNKLDDANDTIADLKDKISELQGQIEQLEGEK
jgi:chromosome segregation ATPase